MSLRAQQDSATGRFRGSGPGLWVGVVLTLGLVWTPACDCAPARSKPWRHAPEPVIESDLASRSDLLAEETERIEARRRRSHTLRVHMRARPAHLNPLIDPSEWTLRVAADTVFETLIRYVPPAGGAGPGRYLPGLARSWRVSSGGREIRLDLQPDVTFHDGRRLTSVDVQFSLDAVRDPRIDADHLRVHFAGITSVELITPTALRIRLARPNAYALRALAQIPILPKHVYERRLRGGGDGPVVGTGPYRIERHDERVIHLRRWDEYRGPAPAIPDIEFVYLADAAEALIAAKRGELDIIPALAPVHYPEQASAPGLEASFEPLRLEPPQLRYLVMDLTEPPFDDVRVRRAVARMIDRETIAQKAHDGLARPVPGPVWPGGPGDGAAPAPPDFDPAGAAALMDQAGWIDGDGDGIRERDGTRLRLSILSTGDDDPERALVVDSLDKLGIKVYPRVGNAAVLRNRLRAGDFDLALVEWRGEVDRDLAPLLGTGGALNDGRFSDRNIDRILGALSSAWEPAQRAPLQAELAEAFASQWPVAPIVAPHPYGLVHRRVRGAVVWNGWLVLRDLSLEPTE
jgi:peptide/nickel transport system substrate-binding protein